MVSLQYVFSRGSSAHTLSSKETTIKFYNKKEIIWQAVYHLSVHAFLDARFVSAKLKGKKYPNSPTTPLTTQLLSVTPSLRQVLGSLPHCNSFSEGFKSYAHCALLEKTQG